MKKSLYKLFSFLSCGAIAFLLPPHLPYLQQPAYAILDTPNEAPAMSACVVTINAPASGGSRANVTCSGAECAFKYITDYIRITSRFGLRNGLPHAGIDLAGNRNTPLKALEPGVVLRTSGFAGNPGNAIELRDDNGRKHFYFHMVSPSPLSVGARVNAGDEVGKMDSTGNSTGDHLHYQISNTSGQYVNPETELKNWPNY